jgi:hypothetical protein
MVTADDRYLVENISVLFREAGDPLPNTLNTAQSSPTPLTDYDVLHELRSDARLLESGMESLVNESIRRRVLP